MRDSLKVIGIGVLCGLGMLLLTYGVTGAYAALFKVPIQQHCPSPSGSFLPSSIRTI